MSVLKRKDLEDSPLADLHAIASELGLESFRAKRKDELIAAILDAAGPAGGADAGDEREPDRRGHGEPPFGDPPGWTRSEACRALDDVGRKASRRECSNIVFALRGAALSHR